MKLNEDKCHLIVSGYTPEFLWAKVGEEMIWESKSEKLLGLTIDKGLKFDEHLKIVCKVSGKISALV